MLTTTPDTTKIADPTLGHLLYGMMLGFPLFGLPLLLSLFINLSQRTSNMAPFMAAHLRWQRYSIAGFISLLLLGFLVSTSWLSLSIYFFSLIWFCHRIIKGWLSLVDGVTV